MTVAIDRSFVALYEFELVEETRGEDEVHWFPRRPREPEWPNFFPRPEPPAIKVRFSIAGRPSWVGVFLAGDSGLGASLVSAMPNGRQACVVASGDGYLVPVDRPAETTVVPLFDITQSLPLPELRLIVLATSRELCAYGPEGMAWMTDRIMIDGMDVRVAKDHLIVRGDSMSRQDDLLRIDLDTGAVQREDLGPPETA